MTPQEKLRSWFLLNQRDLPFRKKKQAYSIWVSEVMLQQTRVAAMLPLYENFMSRFPTVADLARSSEEEVLSAWKGLGYYTRARNLRKAAIYVEQNFNGSFPKDLNEVLKVPGIGPYTARAILSIAYDLKHAVLDGNVKRVLARLFIYEKNILGAGADKDLQSLADNFLYEDFPGDHNQAMMELGATICLPENPKCLLCPLQSDCKGLSENLLDRIPLRTKEDKKLSLIGHFIWLEKGEEILLIKEKKPRFLKGMYVLPYYFEGKLPSEEYRSSELIQDLANRKSLIKLPRSFSHTITHHKFQFWIHKEVLSEKESDQLVSAMREEMDCKWVKKENLENEFPSSLASKVKKIILSD